MINVAILLFEALAGKRLNVIRNKTGLELEFLIPFCDLYLNCFPSTNTRTSLARTLMARLPWLFRTRACVPRKNPIVADLR